MGVTALTLFGEMLCVLLSQTAWLMLPGEECVGKKKTTASVLLALRSYRTRIKSVCYCD